MSKLNYKIKKLNLQVATSYSNGGVTRYPTGSILTYVSDDKYLKTEADINLDDLPKALLSDLTKAVSNIEKHLNDQTEVTEGDEKVLIDGQGIKVNGKTIIRFQ